MRFFRTLRVEWLTLGLIVICLLGWMAATSVLSAVWLPLGIFVTAVFVAFYSSLQHEIIHDHPFSISWMNEALGLVGLSIFIPFHRFRDTHLAHHQDALLTDPYDDPESNYLDPETWDRLPGVVKLLLRFNNILFGRLLIGPIVSQSLFMLGDWRAMRAGDRRVIKGWLWHIPAVLLVSVWLIWAGSMPWWAYVIAAYFGLSILKLRTFLEHQAEEHTSHRTVIIEDRGPLALIFLNNNFHVVHHMHPDVAWYQLPGMYFANRERYLSRNNGYLYRSYGEVLARYFWRAKDNVPHPIWRRSP